MTNSRLAAQGAQKRSQLKILSGLNVNCWYDSVCIGAGTTARCVPQRREESVNDLHGEDGRHDVVVCEAEFEVGVEEEVEQLSRIYCG